MNNLTIDKVNEILEQLKGLRIKEATLLKKRLEQEKKKLILTKPKITISKEIKQISANRIRSTKLKRYWRYIKLIRDNFPNLETNQIRAQLKKRQQGLESDIPDAIWQNPSA